MSRLEQLQALNGALLAEMPVDPELAAGMPLKLAVSSALDAVAHAVESYWARGSNCVSRALALEAVHTMMGGMAEQQEKNGQSPHVEPETDSNAGLSRVRRREQKAVQKKQKRRVRFLTVWKITDGGFERRKKTEISRHICARGL